MATLSVKYLDATYPSLNSALAVANDSDTISIEGTWSADDTTACTISDSVDIITDSDSKCPMTPHDGTGTWYRHRVSSGHAFTVNATKTITFDGVDIQNKSTGTSDECFRITSSSDPTITWTNCLIGFDSRNDQQDGIYADAGEKPTLTFNQCVFYNCYRAVCDFYITEDEVVVNLNSCISYNVGYSSAARSGVVGHDLTGTNYMEVNAFNCYFHAAAGTPISSNTASDTVNVVNCVTSRGGMFTYGLDTDTNNTLNTDAVDSSPSSGDAYFEDVTTSPYNLTIKDDSNNELQDYSSTATALSMTIPSTDFVGTSRPQNTDYDVGPIEIESASGGELSGSNSISVTASGDLKGTSDLSGTNSISVTASGDLVSKTSLSGANNITLTASGDLKGKSDLSGSNSIIVTASGDLKGDSSLSGSNSISVTASGNLSIGAEAALSGTNTISLTTSGNLVGKTSLSGTNSISVTASGDLTLNTEGALSGTNTISLVSSGDLKGLSSLSGTNLISLISSGNLSGPTENTSGGTTKSAKYTKKKRKGLKGKLTEEEAAGLEAYGKAVMASPIPTPEVAPETIDTPVEIIPPIEKEIPILEDEIDLYNSPLVDFAKSKEVVTLEEKLEDEEEIGLILAIIEAHLS